VRIKILGFLASLLIRVLCRTWRVRLLGDEPDYSKGRLVFCFWHGRQAGLFAHPRPRPIAVLASLSRDGALQASILESLGFTVFRGSSSRGGAVGLKAMVDAVADGADAAFAVDGPRGPAFEVKPGAALAATTTHGTLVPITTRASRYWSFARAWDGYRLPKPFAHVDLIRGRGISTDSVEIGTLLKSLQKSLDTLENEAPA
jgi:lysophospholipid acyltransferase (LPLAT)-like uncharacterized protein